MAATIDSVRITDVFLRDGLQAVGRLPSAAAFGTQTKLDLFRDLVAAGVPEIEVTSFVRPDVIPILADAEAVTAAALAESGDVVLRALVPNLKGAERALNTGIRKVAALLAVSPTYQRLNSRMSVEAGLDGIRDIVKRAAPDGVAVAASLAISFICPYEGVIPEPRILEMVGRLVEMGVSEISLADSVGLAWPDLVKERLEAVRCAAPQVIFGLHLHNLGGVALANAFAALEVGVRNFDGAIGGVGSGIAMPVESLDLGNVATEDLNYMFTQGGFTTGIDQAAISELGARAKMMAGGGGSHAAHFQSLDRFLAQSRQALPLLENAPPGEGPTKVASPEWRRSR